MQNLRKVLYVAIIGLILGGIGSGYCLAGETGHYVNGVEGIKAATLPPPGFYYRIYSVFYTADTLTDKDGNELNVNFDAEIFALVNRFIWITDVKLFGGDFFVDMVIPLLNTDIEIGALGVSDSRFGLADINIEPFGISWHGSRYDAAVGLSVYLPTGDYDRTEPASPGKGFWTGMFTLGGTVYFDAGKTWAASILTRYEIHGDKEGQDLRPGDDFHFEWGLSKTLARFWDVGLTGYCHWQVADDSGSDAVNADVHDRVFAAGPEVSVFCPWLRTIFSLRSQWEFEARDRSEGNVTALVITKIF